MAAEIGQRAASTGTAPPGTHGDGPALSQMPQGAWDSHIHVVDPSRYPLAPDATYTPGIYSAWDNVEFEASIGAAHNTIVPPSIYGNDNTAVLEALQAFGPARSRAVVAFDPAATTTDTLQHWHKLGVRGVRVNLGFVSSFPTAEEFKATLNSYAEVIRPLGWVMQMYIPMDFLAQLESFIPTLDTTIVFDHFGHPDISSTAESGLGQPDADPCYRVRGFRALVNLLKSGRAWVKVSAPYRLYDTEDPTYALLDPLIKELFEEAPTRIVYASDWPHTLFEGLDIKPWTEHLLALTGDDSELRDRLFRDNAKQLWGTD